jgi:wobble nucleotide-excising tRNase
VLDDLLHEYESEYHYLFRTVYDVARSQATSPLADYYGLPNIGRRLLETVLAFKFPEKSGELYQQLMAVGGFDEAKKARIMRFTNTYSHNGQIEEPEHDLSILAETPDILRDILSLIEHVDADHYRGMVNSV